MLIEVCRHGIGNIHYQQVQVSGQCFIESIQAGAWKVFLLGVFVLILLCHALLVLGGKGGFRLCTGRHSGEGRVYQVWFVLFKMCTGWKNLLHVAVRI